MAFNSQEAIANLPWNRKAPRANAGAKVTRAVGTARAKRAHLLVEKHDKLGRKYVGQNEVVIAHGLLSAREAQRELDRAADESTERVVGQRVETYGDREVAEMDGNPRRSTVSGQQWGGYYGAAWPPESPTLRRINARREEPVRVESG